MHYALAGEWEAAYRYAVKAIAARKRLDRALIPMDFSRPYETEALLRGGDERQAREEVQRLGECVGPYRGFRTVYLRALPTLAPGDGQHHQPIADYGRTARRVA